MLTVKYVVAISGAIKRFDRNQNWIVITKGRSISSQLEPDIRYIPTQDTLEVAGLVRTVHWPKPYSTKLGSVYNQGVIRARSWSDSGHALLTRY